MAPEPFLATRTQRVFIGTIMAQGAAVLAMIGLVFQYVEEHVPFDTIRYKSVPMYLAVFALAELFELLVAFDALRLRNIIQLIGMLIFHAALIVMSSLELIQTRNALLNTEGCAQDPTNYVQCSGPGTLIAKIRPFLIAVPCVLATAWIAMLFCIRALYFEFGWAIFHVVGADIKARTMYQYYQVIICLLKFDLFAYFGVEIQLLIVVLTSGTVDFAITIVSIPLALLAFIFCGYALRCEIKWMMSICLAMLLCVSALMVYKLYKYFKPYGDANNPFLTGRDTLTVFTVSGFLLIFATFCIGLRCLADFGKGLLDAKTHKHSSYTPLGTQLSDLFGKGNTPNRISSYTADVSTTKILID
ncbi:hypothetical protein FIBSPDRAFT_172590 [Athelia psychrophila]|uniref:Uncharacterized protein n=1 Tax=Athelia psychrophila TaxID=1759441 RepID=A0A166AVI2_9AGAM|nr:hypothetical protein FIBSPDRAFT_172590 [Fibularhizoctonia sp. CBS 109695]